MADFVVTALGVAGFLGFLLVGRMGDANASPFDVFAFVWFFTFGGIKCFLPHLRRRRTLEKIRNAVEESLGFQFVFATEIRGEVFLSPALRSSP
jgi:hypothetical protein